MRLAAFLAPVTILVLAACTEPVAPVGGLSGNWRTAAIPSGAGIGMSLTTNGSLVTGTGAEGGLMGRHIASITVLGHADFTGTFSLTLSYDNGTVATYSGQLVGSDQLRGTWKVDAQSTYSLAFFRQPT